MKYTSTPSLPLSQRLVNEYASYLGQTNWTFYCTLSTKYPLTLNSARRSIMRLHEFIKINQKIENEISWIAEPFDTKYGYHIHALIKLNCLDCVKKKDDVKEPKSAPQRRFTQTSYTDGEQQRRRRVDAAGSNQISYVHLRAMGSTDYAQWARDFYPVANAPP